MKPLCPQAASPKQASAPPGQLPKHCKGASRMLRSAAWCYRLDGQQRMAMNPPNRVRQKHGSLSTEHGRCLEDPRADIIGPADRPGKDQMQCATVAGLKACMPRVVVSAPGSGRASASAPLSSGLGNQLQCARGSSDPSEGR